MEALKEAGLARSIGVSNFSATSLRKVLRIAEASLTGGSVSSG